MKYGLASVCAAVMVALGAGPGVAAPYSITHSGSLSASSIPAITNGQTYDITLVFDNGGTTAASQTWNGASLRCVIWRFNNARNVTYAENLGANGVFAIGAATTNASGVLSTNFTTVQSISGISSNIATTGAIVAPFNWFANNNNSIFNDSNQTRFVSDPSNGVQMAAAGWSNPVLYTGTCGGLVTAYAPPVPTMNEWAMVGFGTLLAGLAGLIAWRRRTAI